MNYQTGLTATRTIKYQFDLADLYSDFRENLFNYLAPEIDQSRENPFRSKEKFRLLGYTGENKITAPKWGENAVNELITEISNDLFSNTDVLTPYIEYLMNRLHYTHDDLSSLHINVNNVLELLGEELCNRYRTQLSAIISIREKYLSESIV